MAEEEPACSGQCQGHVEGLRGTSTPSVTAPGLLCWWAVLRKRCQERGSWVCTLEELRSAEGGFKNGVCLFLSFALYCFVCVCCLCELQRTCCFWWLRDNLYSALSGFDRYKPLLEKIMALSLHYCIRAGVDLSLLDFVSTGSLQRKMSWKGVQKLNVCIWPSALNRQFWRQGLFSQPLCWTTFPKEEKVLHELSFFPLNLTS